MSSRRLDMTTIAKLWEVAVVAESPTPPESMMSRTMTLMTPTSHQTDSPEAETRALASQRRYLGPGPCLLWPTPLLSMLGRQLPMRRPRKLWALSEIPQHCPRKKSAKANLHHELSCLGHPG